MNFQKNQATKNETFDTSYEDFWKWFHANEKTFFQVIKQNGNIEKDFFDKLSEKLNSIKGGFFFLCGMIDDNTAELVLTADGALKQIIFVEELTQAAPEIKGWTFTCLKPPMNIDHVSISMGEYVFSKENLSFYANINDQFPDEIDITIVYHDYQEQDRQTVSHGTYIFLDNYLGELNFLTLFDNMHIIGKADAEKELIPIEKLRDYLIWRQKEFVENEEEVRRETENDNFSILEAELDNGNELIAVVNTDLLHWDGKASHPWISIFILKYDGSQHKGMPDDKDYDLLNEIEENMLQELSAIDGYLYIGRQTANDERQIYFASRDFRQISKGLFNMQQKYSDRFDIEYDLYKDKYWKVFNLFMVN